MKRLIFTGFFIAWALSGYTQCDNSLAETAAARSGLDALFIRDFKVKLEEGNMKRPAPVARYQVFLNQGNKYRFNVVNENETNAKVLLQLYQRNILLNSNYNFNSKVYSDIFEFDCEKSGAYQVVLSFLESKKGCAVGVMSLVLNDSIITTSRSDSTNKELETLFIGIKNEIQVAATDIPKGSLEVSVNQGTVTGSDGRYFVTVEKEGIATITVIARDKDGNIAQTDSVNFNVRPIPLPVAVLNGLHGGTISQDRIYSGLKLELLNAVESGDDLFEIIEFSVARSNLQNGITSYGCAISNAQSNLILKLNRGDGFIINNIVVKGPENKLFYLKQMNFTIE